MNIVFCTILARPNTEYLSRKLLSEIVNAAASAKSDGNPRGWSRKKCSVSLNTKMPLVEIIKELSYLLNNVP